MTDKEKFPGASINLIIDGGGALRVWVEEGHPDAAIEFESHKDGVKEKATIIIRNLIELASLIVALQARLMPMFENMNKLMAQIVQDRRDAVENLAKQAKNPIPSYPCCENDESIYDSGLTEARKCKRCGKAWMDSIESTPICSNPNKVQEGEGRD